MLCQNCQLNEATIHLYTNVNGVKKQNDLCQNCYQIMKAGGPTNLLVVVPIKVQPINQMLITIL
jgi:protein-arginine kinase activator protein McsA